MTLQTLRKPSAFSLVELLVVITILAILSTVAYTSFSGSTDKAKNSKRLEHLGSIETALQMFYQEKSYYPIPDAKGTGTGNLWGYSGSTTALATNTSTGSTDTTNGNILTITTGTGGGIVYGSGTDSTKQMGAKGVMTQNAIGKQFLSQDVADPSSETKVGASNVLKDYGIGRYPYAVFAKPSTWGSDTKSATAFNIAATILDDQKGQVAKVSGNFDSKFTGCTGLVCPTSLIGSGTVNIVDGDTAALPYTIKY